MKGIRKGIAVILIVLSALQLTYISAFAMENIQITDVTVTADVASGKITVSGKASSGHRQEVTLLLRRGGNTVHVDQFQCGADGAFTYVITTPMKSGDVFQLQLSGTGVSEPYQTEFTAVEEPASIVGLAVTADLGRQEITVSGILTSGEQQTLALLLRKGGAVVAETAFESSADGTFRHTVQASFAAGDTLTLELSGAGIVPASKEITVTELPPAEVQITDVTVTADVALGKITVSGKASSGHRQEVTLLLRRGGNTVHADQFRCGADGTFTYVITTPMENGDVFQLQLSGTGVSEPYHTEFTAVEEPASIVGLAVTADLAGQEITVSGILTSGKQQTLTLLLRKGGAVVVETAFESSADGSFRHMVQTSFAAGDTLTLELSGAGIVPASKEITVTELPPAEVHITDVTVTADVASGKITVSGKVSSGLQQEVTLLLKRGGNTVHADQFRCGADGTFTYVIATPMKDGDVFQLQLGGTGVLKPYETEFTVKESGGGGGSGTNVVTYTIKAGAGAGGTITPARATVSANGKAAFTIKADKGYLIQDVLVDGESVGAVESYLFEKVKSNHTIEATFVTVEEGWKNPFTDVSDGAWYYDAVRGTNANGLFAGTSATTFSPDMVMTRAMMVTVLYRLEGEPQGGETVFTDVPDNTWYSKAVAWAASREIVNGIGADLFAPDDFVTREQVVTMLNRYARWKGYDVSSTGDLGQFKDAEQIHAFAQTSMNWAVGCGLLIGKGNGVLDPLGNAGRAEVATILMRFEEQDRS